MSDSINKRGIRQTFPEKSLGTFFIGGKENIEGSAIDDLGIEIAGRAEYGLDSAWKPSFEHLSDLTERLDEIRGNAHPDHVVSVDGGKRKGKQKEPQAQKQFYDLISLLKLKLESQPV